MNDNAKLEGLEIRELETQEYERLADIDRTETIRIGYRMTDGSLERMDVDWDTPRWFPAGDEHSVSRLVKFLHEHAERGAIALGAFDGERLAGIAMWQPDIAEGMDQLAFLHVSAGYRRHGIASELCDRLEALARSNGARTFYVSATPSGSAVGFYRSRGFRPTATPDPELFALEPEDIHMTKPL